MEYSKFISADSQQEIREKLFRCMKAKPLPFYPQAKVIGVCPQTLQKFLDGGDVKFESLCKMESYIDGIK